MFAFRNKTEMCPQSLYTGARTHTHIYTHAHTFLLTRSSQEKEIQF